MGYKKSRVVVFLLILALGQARTSFGQDIYHAYIRNRMDDWRIFIDQLQNLGNKTDTLILELVSYQYGYIGYCMTFDKREEAGKYLDLAEKNIEFLEKKKFMLPDVYSYKSALYGFRMKINPLTVPYNGLKSIRYAKLALELDCGNYMAHIQNGNVYCNMPASIGGSVRKGLSSYLKARELLEDDPGGTEGKWQYLNLLTVIAQSYSSINDLSSAKSTYENILQLEPGFVYVRDILYPGLLKKMEP
ncbi:MAG: hypothetical protein V1903_08430 [Bacteroidota bacterium]